MLTVIVFSQPLSVTATPVQQPVFQKQIKWTGTSWFSSPIVHNLGTDSLKIIGAFYDIFVWEPDGTELEQVSRSGRIYPPAVCADLDGDGIYEIVIASSSEVIAYEWKNSALVVKSGWPVSTCSAGQCPETRGLAAADIDNNGTVEIVATTTQTDPDGAQVFVFNPDGSSFQPPGIAFQAWPRYNQDGDDSTSNGPGNHGYGCYGLNVGIGNLDDDADKEIVVTYDNHHINVFQPDGVSMLASPWFTNRDSAYPPGSRLNWGQFIRWFDPLIEEDHYHNHTGTWPHPDNQKWLQWTDSPPSVVDLNRDGKNEVVCVSNVEKDVPYDTKHHSVMVLEGSYGDGSRSARRLPGWEFLPSSGYPQDRGTRSWYPPASPPAATVVDLNNDCSPEILYAAHDGSVYCTSATAQQLWDFDFSHNRDMMYASEIMVADLNQDNIPEIIFTTYGDPENITADLAHGYLMILDAGGNVLFDIQLHEQGTNGNGKGAPAAPTIADINGDGSLEILIQTFGAGMFIYSVPGSAGNQLLWPTGRGSYLRSGRSFFQSAGCKPSLVPIYQLLLNTSDFSVPKLL